MKLGSFVERTAMQPGKWIIAPDSQYQLIKGFSFAFEQPSDVRILDVQTVTQHKLHYGYYEIDFTSIFIDVNDALYSDSVSPGNIVVNNDEHFIIFARNDQNFQSGWYGISLRSGVCSPVPDDARFVFPSWSVTIGDSKSTETFVKRGK